MATEDIVDTSDDTMLCKRVVTKDRRYITQITCYEKGSEGDGEKDKKALRLPVYAKLTSGGTLASLFNFARQGMSDQDLRDELFIFLNGKIFRFAIFKVEKVLLWNQIRNLDTC